TLRRTARRHHADRLVWNQGREYHLGQRFRVTALNRPNIRSQSPRPCRFNALAVRGPSTYAVRKKKTHRPAESCLLDREPEARGPAEEEVRRRGPGRGACGRRRA